ncbi:unnamed protein product [Rotaria sordida]|uniref:WWE domain-containing protein n=1 Tax=Rotaria sordida TaxID=392033 RepID=A0A814YM31_9BILA|nr:unnamed protein product [Rotaria sordida]
MASPSLSSSAQILVRPRIQWYWALKESSWSSAVDEWQQYTDVENEIIEDAYNKKKLEIELDGGRVLNFERQVQQAKNDKDRQHSIKRVQYHIDLGNVRLREERFSSPVTLATETIRSDNMPRPPSTLNIFKQYCTVKGRYSFEPISRVIEDAIQGIIKTGTALSKQKEAQLLAQNWGTVTEHTRNVLKSQASRNISHTTFAHFTGPRAPITLNYDEGKTLDKNHSHFLLLDNGRVNCYIDDRPRSDFVKSACTEFKCQAITIIVEGGFNTLEVIKHDLMAERPVIIIHGSGRLANVLGTLLENSNEETIPEEKDVKEQLESVFHEHWSKIEENKENVRNDIIETIRELFKQEYRKYLSVFYLEHDPSLTDTIFKAVDAAHADARQQENFLKLAISWNYADRAESVLKHLADDPKLYPSLFEQALKENRPVFVDYFLRRNHSPLQTTEFLKHSESLRMTISNGNESDSDHKISYVDIAFVLLLQLESRMGAALIAAGMAQHLSLSASTLDVRHTYTEQAEKYEAYATDCINACYKHNERLACQLLLRENPLFGNVTCMQIAIASRIIKFINTDCFNQVLNRQWYGHLPGNATESSIAKLKFLLSLISLGLIKHRLRKYRAEDVIDQTSQEIFQKNDSHRWKGIEDQTIKSPNYLQKVFYFHLAPVVKMCYDFAIYIWFLLVFSYMMLFHMNIEENSVHWTRIYLIITVSAMLIEDFRKLAVDYYTRMLERWHRPGIWMIPIYAMPYLLFYIGIILYFRSENQSNLFTAARIILAIDLELWYLFSLRFVSAIKLLGPKLFMIRNMFSQLYLERRCNTPEMNVRWTEFENAATYDYARKFVEDNYRPKAEYQTLKLETQVNAMKNTIDRLQTQIDALNRSNEQARAENNTQMNRMMICMDWIMTAMARVRMSNIPLPTFENSTDSTA